MPLFGENTTSPSCLKPKKSLFCPRERASERLRSFGVTNLRKYADRDFLHGCFCVLKPARLSISSKNSDPRSWSHTMNWLTRTSAFSCASESWNNGRNCLRPGYTFISGFLWPQKPQTPGLLSPGRYGRLGWTSLREKAVQFSESAPYQN